MAQTQRVTSLDGTSIAYEVAGSGPTLVLVDPAGAYRRAGPMRSLAGVLAADFRVVTYDRRGRGESGDTAPYAVDREIEDLEAVIEAAGRRIGVRPRVLVGCRAGAVRGRSRRCRSRAARRSSRRRSSWTSRSSPDTGARTRGSPALIAEGRRGDAVRALQPEHRRARGVPDRHARRAELARVRGPGAHAGVRLRRSAGPPAPRSRTDPGDPDARQRTATRPTTGSAAGRRRLQPSCRNARGPCAACRGSGTGLPTTSWRQR